MNKKNDCEYTAYNPHLIDNARTLRKNMTEEERKLWYCFLRHHRVKFVRQRPIGNYIADFYCAKAKLVIEIDGIQHYDEVATQYDMRRTRAINRLGVEVIRFSNDEINKEFEEVCHAINVAVKERDLSFKPLCRYATSPLSGATRTIEVQFADNRNFAALCILSFSISLS